MKNSIAIDQVVGTVYADLKFVGEGSYDKVFTYKDPNYHIHVVLKRAKPELDKKGAESFRQEFDVLKSLHSPYIVQVYAYNESDNSYTMEYMDESTYKFIQRCNS